MVETFCCNEIHIIYNLLKSYAKICRWYSYAYVLFHPAIHIYVAVTANGENMDSMMHGVVTS